MCWITLGGCANADAERVQTTIQQLKEHEYQFRLWGGGNPPLATFYAAQGTDETRLRAREQQSLAMHRYATQYLRERGLCERGVVGPESVTVTPDMARVTSFLVKCVT